MLGRRLLCYGSIRYKQEGVMRGLALFLSGILVGGIAVHAALGQSESLSPNHGIVGLNHVAIAVPDLEKAVTFYTKTMGFPEAFRVKNAKGELQLVYVQISKGTFIELLPASVQRPPGLNHFGLYVDNMADATAMFKARGANVGEIITTSPTRAILSNVLDLNANRIELAELPPQSLHHQAMDRWH
jgi:catechol 2,3-dioxygenase-like lactoylglutathione lyase family enzyme